MNQEQQESRNQETRGGNRYPHCSCGAEGFATSYALLHEYCHCAERVHENECGFFPLSVSRRYVKVAKISIGSSRVVYA